MSRASVGASLRSSGNISIVKPANGSFVDDDGTGRYGPFNIQYPSYYSNETGKYEFVGDEFTILLNGKKLTTLPQSGVDFYLTEADGVIPGERNTFKIIYKGKCNYSGTYARYIPKSTFLLRIQCRECGATGTYNPEGFYDELNDVAYIDYNTGDIRIRHKTGCSKNDANIVVIGYTIGERISQDVGETFPTCTPVEEEQEIEFWPGRKIEIDLEKKDNAAIANLLKDISFDVSVTGDETYIKLSDNKKVTSTTITTDASGKSKITIITNKDTVRVTINEKNNKYYINEGPIVIDFVYNKGSGTWTSTIVQPTGDARNRIKITQQGEYYQFKLEVINIAKIDDLKLIKINKLMPGEKIPGITFRITLTNAVDESNNSVIIKTTDSNGEIDIGVLKVTDPNKDIIITIEETGVPSGDFNFKGLYPNGEVTIKIKHKQAGCSVNVTGADNEFVDAKYDVNDNTVIVEVKNEITIDLKGKVWEDGQTGIKPVKEPNNLYDAGETGIPNVKVVVKKVSDDSIVATTVTDANGQYEFKDLPATTTGNIKYYIEFIYDGIHYIAVTPDVGADDSIDSDAQEQDRVAFNNKFKTIIKDTAVGTDGRETPLKYDTTTVPTKAILETMDGNEVKAEFAITAKTLPTNYGNNTNNIDLGLLKKGVDLAAVTDIYSAKVNINDQRKSYTYNDIINLNDNIVIDPDLKPNYSLYLYNSDYNYRIKDYSALPVLTDTTHSTLKPEEYDSVLNKKKADGEIEVELTYQILLNNQSATNVTINSIAYYYDTGYILDGANPELVTIDGKQYNKVLIPIGKTFTDTNNQEVYNIIFKVGKDASGALYTGEMRTWVEIVSYSTDEGCIDEDSAPDNIIEHKTEDDTDDARGLNIQISPIDRTINGYVFEDNDKNGKYENNEAKVSDVIVQLIEIKEVDTNGDGVQDTKLEYIWQETVSGSNTVKYITEDGKNISQYNVLNEAGHYTFNNFIPGKYIIRYIYGDGTYYDVSTEDGKANILKYNGQDYKSTIDAQYNIELYNSEDYSANASMARDNEARRIEEIGYAASAGSIGDLIIDSKDKLKDTWMCAETSTLNIPVSDGEDSSVAVVRGLNFGLMKRPQADLVLEKHVTFVKIDGVTEATADIRDYANDNGSNGEFVKFQSVSGRKFEGSSQATSKKYDVRGAWVIGTTLEEITGGVNVTYSYLIKNQGDKEYIGKLLLNELNDGKTYETIANNLKQETKKSQHIVGAYLGTEYYNGKVSSNDILIGIPVVVEDYLNIEPSDLQMTEGGQFDSKGQANKNVWESAGDSSNRLVNVLQSKNEYELKAEEEPVSLTLNTNTRIDTTSSRTEYKYRSYAAQLIPSKNMKTSQAGTLVKGATLGNLQFVQANTRDVLVSEITPEDDEFIAETVEITVKFGGDEISPVLLIVTITGGLVVIALGIILIKKFIIK